MIKIYLAKRNSDMTEGRGPMVLDSAFTKKVDCDAYIDSKPGVFGRKGPWSVEPFGDWETEEILVCENLDEHDDYVKAGVRKNALSKLNETEKKALGLS